MFKVHENGDGSTSIFCSKTGKLICKIRNHQKNMGLGCRPVNVIEPSPKPRSCCYNLDIKPDLSNEDDDQISGKEKCDSFEWNESKEDFSEDCITPEDFARCLNLVPKERFKNEPCDQLKSTFPLRHISRIRPLVTSDDSREIKLEVPITSNLGLKILKLNEQKNFCSDQIETKVKNYDGFCRLQMNAAYVLGQFPKLRLREKKDYPIIPLQNKKAEYTPSHLYAFNKKQRLEKLITFKTGLNTESRKFLLQRCNKRLAVSIKRLPDDEIEYLMQKRARFGPIDPDLIKGEEPPSTSTESNITATEQKHPVYIDLCSDESSSESSDGDDYDPSYKYHSRKDVKIQGVISNGRKRRSVSPLNQIGQYIKQSNTFEVKDCCVVLDNVLFCSIYKYDNDYYVAGTNIRIPFLERYLESLDSDTRKKLVIPSAKLLANARFDHAYHRPFSQNFYGRKLLTSSNCLNQSSVAKNYFTNQLQVSSTVKNMSSIAVSFSNLKNSSSFKPTVSNVVSNPAIIKLDDIPVSTPIQQFEYIFQCYGCGFRETSSNESDIYSEASRHLRAFHCVTDPRSFLRIDRTPSNMTFEAFPGYKK